MPKGAEKGAPNTPVATPVFDGVRPDVIKGLLKSTLPNRDGDPDGRRGRQGAPVRRPHRRTVPEADLRGYMYMLKLHHLVDDKIHRPFHRPVLR